MNAKPLIISGASLEQALLGYSCWERDRRRFRLGKKQLAFVMGLNAQGEMEYGVEVGPLLLDYCLLEMTYQL